MLISEKIRSGGQKGRGLESGHPPGIFARPRFSAAEFRASEAGAPQILI